MADDTTRTEYRTCPLCEAGCGLEITLKGDQIARIRGDRDDVFSHGYICPKGSTLKQLHEDPDRLRTPMVKRDGAWHEATWDDAFAAIEAGFNRVIDAQGRNAVAVYIGNPMAHNTAGQLFGRAVIKALGSTNLFSASTVDQRPKELSAALMFGGALTMPVPDIDRTDYMLMLGANPYASNGSLATAPDWPGRIEALIARGGKLVVVDPRRSRTAEEATEHVAIRPGTDPFLLMAMVQVLIADDLVDLGSVADIVVGIEEVAALAEPFTPEAVEPITGVPAETTRRLAHELAAAPTACVYGRIGTCTVEFGTIGSWLVDVLNVLSGNLDRPGGAMFTKAAVGASNTRGTPRVGRGIKLGRRSSRVRGMAETMGELPVACMAEEMDTPGEGQIRALLTIGGNPVLSTPNSGRLDAAIANLDFMVSVDIYLNETTRHADVILPAPSALQKDHYDIALLQLAVRNVANYSPALLPLGDGEMHEWEVFAKLALILQGMGAGADPAIVDDLTIRSLVGSSVSDTTSPISGRDVEDIVAELGDRRGPARIIDFMVRTGPYGDGFGKEVKGLTLDVLLANPHGIDLGPLEPRMPDALRSPSGMIELAPEPLVADMARLRARLAEPVDPEALVLVGRRHLRSNNSWMHNVNVLMKGKERCTMQVHPTDATRYGLVDGALAKVQSRTGSVQVQVEVTDGIMPGVVSIPHGWGHDLPGMQMQVAENRPGANSNALADELLVDSLSGNAVLNGIPVSVAPAS